MEIGKMLLLAIMMAIVATAITMPYIDLTSRYGVEYNATQFTFINATTATINQLAMDLKSKMDIISVDPLAAVYLAPSFVANAGLLFLATIIWMPMLATSTAGTLGIPAPIGGLFLLIPLVIIIVALIRFFTGKGEGEGI